MEQWVCYQVQVHTLWAQNSLRYGLRSKLLVFNQSIWIANPLPTNATMQMNTWPDIRNILIFRYGPKYETSIQCCSFLNHPLLVVDLFHIIHKQTKLPTQVHKSPWNSHCSCWQTVTKYFLPLACRKLMAIQNKTKTLKNCCV
jgi:hypothetical protein